MTTTATPTATLIAICAGCGQSAFGGALSLTRRCADCARDAGECKSCGAPISAAALDIDGLCNGENAVCIDRYYEDGAADGGYGCPHPDYSHGSYGEWLFCGDCIIPGEAIACAGGCGMMLARTPLTIARRKCADCYALRDGRAYPAAWMLTAEAQDRQMHGAASPYEQTWAESIGLN